MEFNDGPLHSVYTIKILQGEPLILGYLGGPNGRFIKSFLEGNKIRSDFTWIDNEIKTIHIIVDSIQGVETTLIDKGISIDDKSLKVLFQKFQSHISDISYVVISGDIPTGISEDDIKRIIQIALNNQKKVMLSINESYVVKLLEEHPQAVFLNKNILKQLGINYNDKMQMIKECHNLLLKYKIKYIAIDFDIEGIFTITKNKICQACCDIELELYEKHGISDAILGCFAHGLDKRYEQEKLTKLMYAVGLATRIAQYPDLIKRKDVQFLYKKVKVLELMSKSKGFKK